MYRCSFITLLLATLLFLGVQSQPTPMNIYASSHTHGIDYINGTSFSFADNLLIGGPNPYRQSTEFWFRADKSENNAVGGGISHDDQFKFFVNVSSVVKNPRPFLSFDVARHPQKGDFIAGIAYGYKGATQFGTRIEVVNENQKVIYIDTNDVFLYSLMIDNSVEDNFVIYAIGYTFATTDFVGAPSIVITRFQFNPMIFDHIKYNPQQDTAILRDDCYDVWTETNRPSIFKYKNTEKRDFLAIGLIGRCNGIYRAELPSVSQDLSGIIIDSVDLPNLSQQYEIGAVAFDNKNTRMFFTQRHYNSIDVTLKVVNMNTFAIDDESVPLAKNGETSPIIAIDQETGSIYVALADSDRIVRYSKNNDKFEQKSIATLPLEFNKISSAMFFDGYFYFTTWEPKAVIGRISANNFCPKFCPTNGFCNEGKCECVEGFEGEQCLPKHVHEIIEKVQYQTGLNAAFICLTIFIAIAGFAGWFLWHRGKKIYSNQFDINH